MGVGRGALSIALKILQGVFVCSNNQVTIVIINGSRINEKLRTCFEIINMYVSLSCKKSILK